MTVITTLSAVNIAYYCLYSIYHFIVSAGLCVLSLHRLMQAMHNQQ